MDNSILAGKYIRSFMIENQELTSLIQPSNIFPLIANADTKFPFIVYSRNNLKPTYTKSFLTENNVEFTIIVVSDEYVQSLEIANAVRHSLEGYRYTDDYIKINPIHLDTVVEETLDDAYIQRMIFKFTTQ